VTADFFCTPSSIAHTLAVSATIPRSRSIRIADFAAGDGSLLRAASQHWRNGHFTATDADDRHVRRLRLSYPSWSVGRCDFLNARSVRLCRATRAAFGRVDLVLLNPPFSCRGNRTHVSEYASVEVRSSLALAFVIRSIPFLRTGGQLVAVLPASSLVSHKDRAAWTSIGRDYRVSVVQSNALHAFRGCVLRTDIVHLVPRTTVHQVSSSLAKQSACHCQSHPRAPTGEGEGLDIVRGSIDMHSWPSLESSPGLALVHTTELRGRLVTASRRRIRTTRSQLRGPAVLLPRVGEPSRGKVSLLLSRDTVHLSSCVYGLPCKSQRRAASIRSNLLRAWDLLEGHYVGSCARYLTVNSLRCVLRSLFKHE